MDVIMKKMYEKKASQEEEIRRKDEGLSESMKRKIQCDNEATEIENKILEVQKKLAAGELKVSSQYELNSCAAKFTNKSKNF